MRRWVRNSLLGLCALLVILAGAYWWLFVESHLPRGAEYVLDIAKVRGLAAAARGETPLAIEVETVGLFKPPAAFVVAGDGWQPTEVPVYSYRVAYPQTSVIIDTALNQEIAAGYLDAFDAAAFARIQAAMSQSSLILLTHEHADHIGGLTSHPNLAAALAATKMTREQMADPAAMLPAKFPEHALDGYVPLEYLKYLAVAPGMVLIKSAGHTPGSQMVYVQTVSGTEFLFIGDVAWHFRNIELQRERARFASQFVIEEDRAVVLGQLRALHALHEAEPRINIVPGHDGVAVKRLMDAGLMRTRFTSSPGEQRDSQERQLSP